MSHYTRKTPCKKCKSYEYDCGCPEPKVKEVKKWVVYTKDFVVSSTTKLDLMDWAFLDKSHIFLSKKEATKARPELIEKRILILEGEIERLKALKGK